MPTPFKGIFVDATNQTVTEIVVQSWDHVRALLGGYMEGAYSWPSGDCLFVDEEGLLKDGEAFFRLQERPDQPLAGNAVLLGREKDDEDGNHDPSMTAEQLGSRVRFVSRAVAVELMRGKPIGMIYDLDQDLKPKGPGTPIGEFDELFRD